MTKEQIESWREQVMANRRYGGSVLLLSIQETDDLLAAAERARVLEDVLSAAEAWWSKKRPVAWSEQDHRQFPIINTVSDAERALAVAVCAAIDRAEGR